MFPKCPFQSAMVREVEKVKRGECKECLQEYKDILKRCGSADHLEERWRVKKA
jgi:hypothetical protein